MIHVRNVSKRYETPGRAASSVNAGTPGFTASGAVQALDNVSIDVVKGEAVALMGASGSGKSTLLHLMGGLDMPTSGEIEIEGRNLCKLDDAALSQFRRERVGFVFQFFHLLPTLSVLENVLLPGRLARINEKELLQRAQRLLERVGLAGRDGDNPDVLSGGQQQRVALARALITRPVLLLADEPTGNLDSANSGAVLALMKELVKENATTLLMATHSVEAAQITTRTIQLKDGRVLHS